MTRTIPRDVERFCLRFLEALNTPRSLGIHLLIRSKEWTQIANLRCDPAVYLDTSVAAEKFRRDYQATELLRKYEDLPCASDGQRKFVAEVGFSETERTNYNTNRRLAIYLDDYPVMPASEWRIMDFIRDVRKIIKGVLGPVPDTLDGKFGPGTVFEARGHPHAKRLTLGDKMSLQQYCCTEKAQAVGIFLAQDTAWGRAIGDTRGPFSVPVDSTVYAPGNRFTTVPKDALKDRGICIEPGLNVFAQLAIGQYMKRRLLSKAGINLLGWEDNFSPGQELHRRLAREGSVSNALATIDLSSASDTVCINLVRLLLPGDWYELLDSVRSHRSGWAFDVKDGKGNVRQTYWDWFILDKFSSMGNGFTFELETLIFYALAKAVGAEDVKVYGDDIICKADKARDVIAALRWAGFTPNTKKTHLTGPFRESCGGDYFLGVDVTPYRLVESPAEPHQWISAANGLWRWGSTHLRSAWSPWRGARRAALGMIPLPIRTFYGPERLGDLVIHAPEKAWSSNMIALTYQPYTLYGWCWRPVGRTVKLSAFHPDVQMALLLYGADSSGLKPRGAVAGYKMGVVSFS